MPSVEFVPVQDFTAEQWREAYAVTYNPDLNEHMGTNPELYQTPPTLQQFYRNFAVAFNDGKLRAWGILRDGEYVGHTLLDRQVGEWEIGTVLRYEKDRNSGLGVRATLHALKEAFEVLDAPWVVAFAQGKTDLARDVLVRGGFKPLMNFYVMDKDTWEERWSKPRRNK